LRIISGKYKGRHIPVPSGFRARPTTDFAREGLFNILSNTWDFDDLDILDLQYFRECEVAKCQQ